MVIAAAIVLRFSAIRPTATNHPKWRLSTDCFPRVKPSGKLGKSFRAAPDCRKQKALFPGPLQ